MMIGAHLFAAMLLLPAVAHAQCAWVLWSKVGGTVHDASGWDAEEAFDSRDKCVAKITRIKQQFDPDHLSTWYAVGKQQETAETRVSYRMTILGVWEHVRCLPAGVDPGRPKPGAQ